MGELGRRAGGFGHRAGEKWARVGGDFGAPPITRGGNGFPRPGPTRPGPRARGGRERGGEPGRGPKERGGKRTLGFFSFYKNLF